MYVQNELEAAAMSTNMQRTASPLFTIRVDGELLEAFRATADAVGVSQSRVVRDAMLAFLRQHGAEVTDAIKEPKIRGRRSVLRKTAAGEAMAA